MGCSSLTKNCNRNSLVQVIALLNIGVVLGSGLRFDTMQTGSSTFAKMVARSGCHVGYAGRLAHAIRGSLKFLRCLPRRMPAGWHRCAEGHSNRVVTRHLDELPPILEVCETSATASVSNKLTVFIHLHFVKVCKVQNQSLTLMWPWAMIAQKLMRRKI